MTEEISYKLEVFEGPLDLLLSLISKNKVDIYDIPISLIFDQYMDYIDKLQELNMDVASSFIVMASELMLIKSRMLLPKPKNEEEEDPRDDLVTLLLMYQQAKKCAQELSERWDTYSGRYIKETDEVLVDKNFVSDQDTAYLVKALEKLVLRIKLDKAAENEDSTVTLNSIVRKKPASVSARTRFILEHLKERGHILFEDLMLMSESRSELVASFIALLTLISVQRVMVSLEDPENPMVVMKEGGENVNIEDIGLVSEDIGLPIEDDEE